jgi:hypothetical protein
VPLAPEPLVRCSSFSASSAAGFTFTPYIVSIIGSRSAAAWYVSHCAQKRQNCSSATPSSGDSVPRSRRSGTSSSHFAFATRATFGGNFGIGGAPAGAMSSFRAARSLRNVPCSFFSAEGFGGGPRLPIRTRAGTGGSRIWDTSTARGERARAPPRKRAGSTDTPLHGET